MKDDLNYEAWGVIANAHEGDWSKATPEWRDAAERWRDRWHETLEPMAMLTIDARCNHPTCDGKDIYRMVGSCSNCGTKDILILFSAGHDAMHSKPCPVCGCDRVQAQRLATEDEIPDV